MLKFNFSNLRKSQQTPWFIIDAIMLGMLTINLLLIVFDSLFDVVSINDALHQHLPAIAEAYQPIHDNFLLIDLIFISIFLVEFFIRWAVAIKEKEYLRWYFFPFIHWYDLVGCIPVTTARVFRLLRIISILHRLHKYRIVDLKDTGVYRFFRFYYNVFIEELSDRIVVKVLSDVQQDISGDSDLLNRIQSQVLAPRRVVLHHWLSSLALHVGDSIADQQVGESVREHIALSVSDAVRNNAQVQTLTYLPVVGSSIERLLETAVADIVVQAIVNMLQDMTPQRVGDIIDHGLTAPSVAEQALTQEVLGMVNETIELVKEHVSVQQWKDKLD
ncbi:ion transporter [Alteromonas sp. a30]|uniref:ion transporter n=1 Tax=Alteromonas sp. a30 TaxID=2730917 RepID=UPI002281E9DA|nr:ion transporter [Alteromonas sp. a30]MCY7295829.1 ion transporter [Alteromonas sp. a30]